MGAKPKAAGRRTRAGIGSGELVLLSDNRAMEIVNNVAEEFVDQGKTSFASKADLCRTILWLRNNGDNLALIDIRQSVAMLSMAKDIEATAFKEIEGWLARRAKAEKQNTHAQTPKGPQAP